MWQKCWTIYLIRLINTCWRAAAFFKFHFLKTRIIQKPWKSQYTDTPIFIKKYTPLTSLKKHGKSIFGRNQLNLMSYYLPLFYLLLPFLLIPPSFSVCSLYISLWDTYHLIHMRWISSAPKKIRLKKYIST